MAPRRIIGMLTPSSNTVLEPLCSAMLWDLWPEVTAHFGRFRVTEISLSDRSLGQFDQAPLIAAARLLSDARVDVIAWNGTSGGWLGLEADRSLCAAIMAATGVPATTSSLALLEALGERGLTRYGLVTPYLDDIQARIQENFAREGLTCAAERHLGDKGNFSFSEIDETRVEAMIRAVARGEPEAIIVYCTNLRGPGSPPPARRHSAFRFMTPSALRSGPA